MNLFLENPRVYANNIERAFKLQGPFVVSRDQSIVKPLFKHSDQWSQKQQIKFAVFFCKNWQRFLSADRSQQWNIFKQAAKFIRTRNFTQCKSQYVKAMKKFGNIPQLIQHLQDTFYHFQKQFECYAEELEALELASTRAVKSDKFVGDEFDNGTLAPTDIQYEGHEKPLSNSSSKMCSMPHSIAKKFYPQLVIESQININQMKACISSFMMWKKKVTNLIDEK